MANSIQINFINQSTDANNSQIVIFAQPPWPAGNGDGNEAPLLVHGIVSLPPAGGHVSVDHTGDSIALAVALSATAGEVLGADLSPQPPVRLALPDRPSATILVQGGGAMPFSFTFAAAELATPPAEPAGPTGDTGLLGRVLAAIRGILRSITGGR